MDHLNHARPVLWALGAMLVNPVAGAAAAPDDLDVDASGGLTIDIDLLAPSGEAAIICFARPANWHPKLEPHFRSVFEGAAEATRPPHATSSLRFAGDSGDAGCTHQLSMTLEDGRKGEPRSLTIQLVEAGTVRLQTSAGPLVPYRSTVDQFEPAWREIWPIVAPSPAPSPSAPDTESRYVDDDLVEARSSITEDEPEEASEPLVTALALGGLTTRSVSLEPSVGRTQDIDALFSLGARAELHLARWFGWSGHRLEGRAEYWHQFASASVDGESIETNADRVRGGLIYGRRWFGPRAPEIGVSAGFEYRRFLFADAANTISSEVSAFRPGLELEQRLLDGEAGQLALRAGGRARVPVAASSGSGDFDIGFDADAGLRFAHPVGFVAEVTAEYTRQSATLSPVSFAEDSFDVLVAIGWSL